MKFDIISFTRAFPCLEYQMLVRFASIRRLTVVEWIIINAADKAQNNQTIANTTIEKLFSTVYQISKCETLVRTSVYELRNRKLVEIDEFDEFVVSALKFGDIRITELGKKAISNNYIPSESQTRDESLYHNLSLDLFKSFIHENDNPSMHVEAVDPLIAKDFPRGKMLSLLNSGKLLDSKYAAQQYLVEDLDLIDSTELSELITFNVSIDNGELVCNYGDHPVVKKIVKDMLSKALVIPAEYTDYDEASMAVRNIALGDDVFDLISAYSNDVNNNAIFSTLEVYKEYKRHFKKTPDNKVWFVFDSTKKTFEISSQTKGHSLTVYIPRSIKNSATVLGGTNGNHIVAKKYMLPFSADSVDCIITTKEKCDLSEYTSIVENIIAELSVNEPSIIALYALPVLGGEVYTKFENRWTNITTITEKIADLTEVYKGLKNLQISATQIIDMLHSLIKDYSVNSYDEAKNLAERIAKSFDLTKDKKCELGLCLLSNGNFEKSYSAIEHFLTDLVGSITVTDESFTAFEEYGNALYTPAVLEELFSKVSSSDDAFPSPWSKYEVAFIKFLFSLDRIKNSLTDFEWNKENDRSTLCSLIFSTENPKDIIVEILTLRSLINSINSFNDFKLEKCKNLSSIINNANVLFDIASHFADRTSDEIREIYVIDTCALLNHTDLLDHFSKNETIIIPAIVESELGAQKKKLPAAQVAIRSIEKHILANDQFGYERCHIEGAHMDLISEHDFFVKQNDPRVISVARYYIAFNPVIITDDVDMRNLASSLKIKSIGSNEFLQNHSIAVEVKKDRGLLPKADLNSSAEIDPLEALLDAPIYKFAKKFCITAEEISLLSTNRIRTYGEFVETKDEIIRSFFGKKQFLSNHLLEAKKKVRNEIANLQSQTENNDTVDQREEDGENSSHRSDESLHAIVPTLVPIDDIALRNNAAAGYMKDVLIINIFNHHFSVTEKLQDKKIFRDFLALGVGIGEIFKDVDKAKEFAQAIQLQGNYRNIVEVDYADFLKDQGFDLWVVTLQKFRDRFSVFLSFKNEELSRTAILERAKFGKHFKRHSLAMEYANKIVSQFNHIFDNNESIVIEETVAEVDVATDIIYDYDDEPLWLCKNESKQLLWRDNELQYQFIDTVNYRIEIQQQLDTRCYKYKSFAESGMNSAFEIAMYAALPALHNEVYRAESLLALLGADPELNQSDIEFYTSYIQTLTECVDIQKQYQLPVDFKLTVLVYDENNVIKPAENLRVTIPAGGTALNYNGERTIHYDIVVHDNYASFFESIEQDTRQIVFMIYGSQIKEADFIDVQTAIHEKTGQTVFTGNEKKDIAKLIRDHIRLAVSIDSLIEDEWIAGSPMLIDETNIYDNDEEAIADEETIEVTSSSKIPVSIEIEEKTPVTEWKDTNTLYIYKGQNDCAVYGHDIIQTTATLVGFQNREIKMNVNFCKDCNRFFITNTTYELYRNRYGVLLGNMCLEGGKNRGEFNDVVLAEASPLKLCGYNVNQTVAYSAEQRQYIIANIIDRGIMSKSEVIRYLEYFISINGRRAGNELALSKWKDDLLYTIQYDGI